MLRSARSPRFNTYELVDQRHLGTLLSTQQAVHGVGGAVGPLAAGALFSATGSYASPIALITLGFAAATGVLLIEAGHHGQVVGAIDSDDLTRPCCLVGDQR